jgi:hypothetical protein
MKKSVAVALFMLGHAGAASAAPDWCKDASFKDDYNLKDVSSNDPGTVLATLARRGARSSA